MLPVLPGSVRKTLHSPGTNLTVEPAAKAPRRARGPDKVPRA